MPLRDEMAPHAVWFWGATVRRSPPAASHMFASARAPPRHARLLPLDASGLFRRLYRELLIRGIATRGR